MLVYLKLRHFGRLYLFWEITCPALCVQVAGRLHIELMRVSGAVPERLSGGDDSSENSSESSCFEVMDTNGEIVHMSKRLTCRVKESLDPNKDGCLGIFWELLSTTAQQLLVSLLQVRIREATGLPLNLSNFVFCQYTFWEHGEPTVAPPMVSPDSPSPRSPDAQFTVQFDQCKVNKKERLIR